MGWLEDAFCCCLRYGLAECGALAPGLKPWISANSQYSKGGKEYSCSNPGMCIVFERTCRTVFKSYNQFLIFLFKHRSKLVIDLASHFKMVAPRSQLSAAHLNFEKKGPKGRTGVTECVRSQFSTVPPLSDSERIAATCGPNLSCTR